MIGTMGILNVGAGDTKISFDPSNPVERARAARIVKDMLKRGYFLLVETGKDAKGEPTYQRAKDFDENTAEYIIADFDADAAEVMDKEEGNEPKRAKRTRERRIDAGKTSGVAVARTAGG